MMSALQSNQYEEIMRLLSETHLKDLQLKEALFEIKTLKGV